jgi:hypothetical protein
MPVDLFSVSLVWIRRAKVRCPAGTPKPGEPGPGRPPGSKNRHPAPRHDVGKTTKRNSPSRRTANAQVIRQAQAQNSRELMCRGPMMPRGSVRWYCGPGWTTRSFIVASLTGMPRGLQVRRALSLALNRQGHHQLGLPRRGAGVAMAGQPRHVRLRSAGVQRRLPFLLAAALIVLPGGAQDHDDFDDPEITAALEAIHGTANPDRLMALMSLAEELVGRPRCPTSRRSTCWCSPGASLARCLPPLMCSSRERSPRRNWLVGTGVVLSQI